MKRPWKEMANVSENKETAHTQVGGGVYVWHPEHIHTSMAQGAVFYTGKCYMGLWLTF